MVNYHFSAEFRHSRNVNLLTAEFRTSAFECVVILTDINALAIATLHVNHHASCVLLFFLWLFTINAFFNNLLIILLHLQFSHSKQLYRLNLSCDCC